MPATVSDLDTLLAASKATDEFKQEVRALRDGRAPMLITYNRGVPPVKALRGIMKLLEEAADVEIRQVNIQGTSGCSDFTGKINVNDGEMIYDFEWDCAWRAEEEGFVDGFGYPNQIKAAREFGYQCFRKFRLVS